MRDITTGAGFICIEQQPKFITDSSALARGRCLTASVNPGISCVFNGFMQEGQTTASSAHAVDLFSLFSSRVSKLNGDGISVL